MANSLSPSSWLSSFPLFATITLSLPSSTSFSFRELPPQHQICKALLLPCINGIWHFSSFPLNPRRALSKRHVLRAQILLHVAAATKALHYTYIGPNDNIPTQQPFPHPTSERKEEEGLLFLPPSCVFQLPSTADIGGFSQWENGRAVAARAKTQCALHAPWTEPFVASVIQGS